MTTSAHGTTTEGMTMKTARVQTPDDELIAPLRDIMQRTGLTYVTVAAAIGVAQATVRIALLSGRAPQQSVPRARFKAFVERNVTARDRSELRYV